MGALAIPTLIKDAPWILCGVLALVCTVFFGLWKAEEARYANYKTEQAAAVIAAQERADKLANELEAAQAKSMAITGKATNDARAALRNSADDVARLRAIAVGMCAILGPECAQAKAGPPNAVPASRADR